MHGPVKQTMTIPEIRARMCEIPGEIDEENARHHAVLENYALEILQLAEMTKRRPSAKPRARTFSRRMTHSMAAAIRADVRRDPRVSVQWLAEKYKVNVGRVSEALNGKR